MKSRDILSALENTEEKYIVSAKKLIDKKKKTGSPSGVFGALKFAAGAALVLAVVLAIWIPSVYIKNHQDPASSDTQTDTNTEPVDTTRYNCFVCGDQTVQGLEGFLVYKEYRDDDNAWIFADGSGISSELINMTDPPTLYFKPGDKITFIYGPDVTPGYLQLWKSDGSGVITQQAEDEIYSYLKANPGRYYITATYQKYGRTVGGGQEEYSLTRGVRLICEGPAGSTEEQTDTNTEPVDTTRYNCFVCGDQAVEGLKGLIYCTEYRDEQGAWIEGDGLGISFELIDMTDPPTLYCKPGDKITFIYDPDVTPGGLQLWNSEGTNTVASEYASQYSPDLYSYLEENPGQYYITAGYYTYGRTIGDKRESYGYTRGVRLIYGEAPESTEAITTEPPEDKPDEETVIIREAVAALNELYQAVLYGSINFYKEDLINKIDFTVKDYTQTVKYDYDTAGREEHQGRYECAEEDFYAYFEKYMTSDLVRSFVKSHAYAIDYVENVDIHAPMCLYDGKISVTGYLGYQSPSSINADSVRLISQNGNTATLGVEFKYGHGMTSTPIELELEVIEDKNGIRITGGELIEKTLWPTCFGITGEIINTYMIMREGVFLENRGIYYKIYNSYNELPNELKKEIEPDARFPLIVKDRVIPDSWTERWCTEEIGSALFDNTNDMYDGKYIYPDKAPGRVEQTFFGSPKIKDCAYKTTGSEVLAAMKMIKSNKNGFEFSLDFKVDGSVKAYTFEYTVENGNVTLTGGTFITELIMKTPEPKSDEETVMIREAVAALNEMYQAANYGNIKYNTDLIGKLNFTIKTYTATKDGYTESHDRYECDEEEFYAYFDKYLPSGMARSYVKARAVDIGYLETESIYADICLYGGRISLSGELAYQAFDIITASTARLTSRNGNTATVGVEFKYGHGMMSTPIELELEIVKDDNGVRITGGELIDKTINSSVYSMTGMLIYDYMVMRECVFLEDLSIYGKVYSSHDELPNDMKNSVDPDAAFPLILKDRVLYDLWLIDEYMTKEIYDALFVDTTDVYDGKYLYPDKAPGRVEQAFFGSSKIKDRNGYVDTGSEVLAAMKMIKSDENGVTISLDFKVNGKVKAYTFEYTVENGNLVLTGGTFVTEVIFGK